MITAVSAYNAARNAVQPGAAETTTLRNTGAEFEKTLAAVDQTAAATMQGTGDTHQLVQAIAEAELALETVVAVRDKVIEAYQDILRMPV